MFSRLCLGFVLLLTLTGVATAKARKGPPGLTIKEVSPASVTLTAGNEVEHTYNFTSTTKITVDGLPTTVDDLRAGMAVSNISIAPDNVTALAIDAKKAPRVTKKPPPVHIFYYY